MSTVSRLLRPGLDSRNGSRPNWQFDAIGLPPTLRSTARAWAAEHFEKSFGWPGVFYSLQDARAAKGLFFPAASNIEVIGLGVPVAFSKAFLNEVTPPAPEPGRAPIGAFGCYQVAKQHQPLPVGDFLGVELLSVGWFDIADSSKCNGLEADFAALLGIRPNEYGLLDNLETAKRCRDAIEQGPIEAEPGLWLLCGLIRY